MEASLQEAENKVISLKEQWVPRVKDIVSECVIKPLKRTQSDSGRGGCMLCFACSRMQPLVPLSPSRKLARCRPHRSTRGSLIHSASCNATARLNCMAQRCASDTAVTSCVVRGRMIEIHNTTPPLTNCLCRTILRIGALSSKSVSVRAHRYSRLRQRFNQVASSLFPP